MLTDARVISALTLRSRVRLKRELLSLCRAHAAAAAFLWTATQLGDRSHSIETVGEPGALPRSRCLQGPVTTTCEQRSLCCADGEEREAVLLYSRLCADAPTLVVGLVDARAPYTDLLTDDIESAVERIESLLVDIIDPMPTSQATERKLARGT